VFPQAGRGCQLAFRAREHRRASGGGCSRTVHKITICGWGNLAFDEQIGRRGLVFSVAWWVVILPLRSLMP
jgi:hypothetical protein